MTPKEIELQLSLDEASDPSLIKKKLESKLGRKAAQVATWSLRRKSIDARGGRTSIRMIFTIAESLTEQLSQSALPINVRPKPKVVIIGHGPAGLFCAYQLARLGIGSTVIDRGKPVQPRRHDLAALNRGQHVNPDSNYCFGEGGAGTYSDGKLYSRADKRGNLRDVLEVLALHGAPHDILIDARPHIGSNKLPKVLTAMRERLESVGVQFRFESRVSSIQAQGLGANRQVKAVALADGTELEAEAVVVATGHSARDIYHVLYAMNVELHSKPFALGVRIEHPQPLINKIPWGYFRTRGDL